MIVTSSSKRRPLFFTATVIQNYGPRKRHLTYLTSPWVVYDGAESCKLVGAYLLYLIKEEFRDTCDFGLYRDDSLGVSKATPRQTDLIKKKLCTIFRKNGLRIAIEVNKHTVNFLDVTLDLKNGTHRPFSKPGNIAPPTSHYSKYP